MELKNKMDLINKYTSHPVTEDDVFTFNFFLCNNEIDNDFEAFDIAALNQLCKLCVGKTSAVEYPWDACLSAKIYDAWIETDPVKKTSYGDPFTTLKASAYIIRNDDNAEFINELNSDMEKRITISCSTSKVICSICGKDKGYNCCSHVKGVHYKDESCFHFLSNVQEFFEWSFIMVEEKPKNYSHYDGDESIVKIITRDCNGKWTTLEMHQTKVCSFLDDKSCPMTEDDEIMMVFVDNVCIYSQLANGTIDWDDVSGFFA